MLVNEGENRRGYPNVPQSKILAVGRVVRIPTALKKWPRVADHRIQRHTPQPRLPTRRTLDRTQHAIRWAAVDPVPTRKKGTQPAGAQPGKIGVRRIQLPVQETGRPVVESTGLNRVQNAAGAMVVRQPVLGIPGVQMKRQGQLPVIRQAGCRLPSRPRPP